VSGSRADPHRLRRSRIAVTATFASHALAAGTLGPWIPRLKADCDLDAAGLGLALTGYAAGLLAGTRLADPTMQRAGGRAVVRCTVPAVGAGLALLSLGTNLASLACAFAAFGVASGVLDVAMNTEAVTVEKGYGRRVMSSMHATWSVSVLAGAALATAGVAAEISIGVHLVAVAVALALVSATLLAWLPSSHVPSHDGSAQAPPRSRASTSRVVLLCVIAFASFLAEGVAADWSAVFLRESVRTEAATAGLGVVAFSAGMTVSRFAGDWLATRFDPPALVRAGALAGGVALAAALIAGGAAVSIAALVILGLGLGPIVPLAFSAAGGVARANGRTALAIVVTSGYVGSIVGPLVVGFIADRVGWRAAFATPVALCVAAAVSSGALSRLVRYA